MLTKILNLFALVFGLTLFLFLTFIFYSNASKKLTEYSQIDSNVLEKGIIKTDNNSKIFFIKVSNFNEDFAVYRISPFADKFKLYFMYYLAYTKPHILSVDVYVLQDSKNAVLNIVYVDGSTITSFTTKLIDILTDCNYINEPELHYDSDFKLFLPHNQLREYYRVNTEDFKALVDSFKLS